MSRPAPLKALEDNVKSGTSPFVRRFVSLAVAGILAGGAGGVHGPWRRIPAAQRPRVHRPGVVRLQLQLRERATSTASQLAYIDHGSNPLGSPFAIHGIVDTIDPVLESAICIGQNPPPPETADLPGPLPADVIGAGGLPRDLPDAGDGPRRCAASRSSCRTTTGTWPRRRVTSSRSSCRPLPLLSSVLIHVPDSPRDRVLRPGRLLAGGNITVN